MESWSSILIRWFPCLLGKSPSLLVVGWIPFGWIHFRANFGPYPAQVLTGNRRTLQPRRPILETWGCLQKCQPQRIHRFLLLFLLFRFKWPYIWWSNGVWKDPILRQTRVRVGEDFVHRWVFLIWDAVEQLPKPIRKETSPQNQPESSVVTMDLLCSNLRNAMKEDKWFRNSQKVTHQIIRVA